MDMAFRMVSPEVQTHCVDLLEYTNPRLSAIVQKTYMITLRQTPELWDFLYDRPWPEGLTRRVRRLIQSGNSKALKKLMDDFRPDIAVCTQAHPLGVLAAYAENHRPDLQLWGVVTDYVPHRFWVVSWPASYIVPNEAAVARLALLGVDRRRLFPLGIPIRPGVGPLPPEARPKGERHVLVMGGSRGLGVRYQTVRSLDRSPISFSIEVVTGNNRRLRARLLRNRRTFKHPLRVRGFVKNAVELMQRADLLISKPGGITSAEAMAVGLPMVLVRPLPGQERGNTDLLVREGAAIHVREDREVGDIVTFLFQRPQVLECMRERALSLGRPNAALDAARLILSQDSSEP